MCIHLLCIKKKKKKKAQVFPDCSNPDICVSPGGAHPLYPFIQPTHIKTYYLLHTVIDNECIHACSAVYDSL